MILAARLKSSMEILSTVSSKQKTMVGHLSKNIMAGIITVPIIAEIHFRTDRKAFDKNSISRKRIQTHSQTKIHSRPIDHLKSFSILVRFKPQKSYVKD